MASPATTQTVRPLDTMGFHASGPPQITDVVAEHLRLLGARSDGPAADAPPGRVTLCGGGFEPGHATVTWAEPGSGLVDEATVQAATGMMAVHGRRDGSPRGLAADYAATATGILAVQGLLAGLVGQARGTGPTHITAGADRAGLLAVSQYLAAAGADEGEAAELAPGGPPFTSAEGVLFELETLDPGAWAAFWRALGAPADAMRAGWRPFQFRYATACAPFPRALHSVTRSHPLPRIRQAAALSGAEVCVLRTLAERALETDGAAPWSLRPLPGGPAPSGPRTTVSRTTVTPSAGRPLAGLTVLEAGRRIQAPLAAHLLGLLGAEIIRIEPPGGDPLRGMPPACSGISARWLALNRGKQAVEVDIKAESGRRRLREMAAEADVFLHNWAPGKAAELGLDADDLARVNPALVHAYTSGWADRLQDAPMGTDFMVQARTAVGEAVRPEGEPPAPSLMTLLDVLGGLHGAEAVLAGLLLRERTGHGVRVDSSLLGAADTLTGPALRRAARGQDARRPAGFRHPLPTADGWLAPADACAGAAAAYDLRDLSTSDAVALLSAHGLAATAVTTDLSALHHDARFAGQIGRDAHGAPAVPAPWSLV
ncbi:E-cinnamoyl-CoA:R-phenyllactate CoA transferase [Streptomyces lavendulae subsp. lavendulae]|uniref:E-cinnamoyl-CoA:R-phenyllactate CoA transferase n=1 Tax=Streptomyces lavendulae subsp. lavendulae TaxID=58340 RepID=A0A2K8PPI3_STRLA|nr:CoA transferase [Streptomyces lavendulae]ATZ28662.1 E-cinnamoyl-CoA:R-phenyllactate CoA transferase [Streptomyces lavendulae subsp. lavendulae]QUQ58487.1 Formyl-CoA:oxalate CoA-transferase [Streptomyces lavendulae subsp. lavendulae]